MKTMKKLFPCAWELFLIKKCYGGESLEGGCKLMMVSHDVLVEMETWENNNLLTWRDDFRYFYNEFEYGVKRWNVGK